MKSVSRCGLGLMTWLFIASSIWAQDGLTEIHQDFSKDPGWESKNNRVVAEDPPTINQDFGWSPTNHTGAGPGEIGGKIWMSRTPAYYALPLNKPLSFKDKFSFSGRIAFMPTGGGAAAYLGFFNHELQGWRAWNSMAVRLGGETGGEAAFGADSMSALWHATGGAEGYLHVAADGKPHTFSFEYDPDAVPTKEWPDPRLEKYITRERQDTDAILKLAQADEPGLTREELIKRLEAAHAVGLIQYLQRTGTESVIGRTSWSGHFWFLKKGKDEDFRGAMTIQVDDSLPIKHFIRKSGQEEPVYMDRFGLFNMQLYHQFIDFYVGDLTVNGHKIELSKEPGWEGRGNRVQFAEQDFQREDYGYSETNWAGKEIGEVGGQFTTTESVDPYHGYYVDDIGKLGLDDPLSFSGTVCFAYDSTDAGMQIGYFDSKGLNAELGEAKRTTQTNTGSIGIYVEGSASGGKRFMPQFTSNKDTHTSKQEIHFNPTQESRPFSFKYDPTANNNLGRITITIGDETTSLDLTKQQREEGAAFDRFGVANLRNGGKFVVIYFDDLTYTARRAKDYKPVFHKQEVVKVPYPEGGRKY